MCDYLLLCLLLLMVPWYHSLSDSIISKTQIISRSVIHLKKNRKNKPAPPPGLPPEEKPPVKEQPKKQPFLKRLLFGEETPDLSELEAGSTTILDILSPTSVDTKSRDYIVVDGIFHAYLYITGYGYSTTVGASWLAPLVEAGKGVSISFHFDKQSKEKILAKIS